MKRSIFCLAIVCSMLCLSSVVWADNNSITAAGIGQVKTGASISKLPKQIAGIYDKLELVSKYYCDEGGYEDTISIYRATLNGETVFEFYPEDEKIGSISVYSKTLKTNNGLSLNSCPADLFSAGGKVISFNSGGEAILCDGLLFQGLPMTQQGYKKSEQAYFGEPVTFDVSDFEANGHPSEILISEYYAKEFNSASVQNDVWDIILGVLFILVVLAMIAHMVYVNYFVEPYPEVFDSVNAKPENNAYVRNALDALYNGEFTPLCNPHKSSDPDTFNYPVGKKAAYHAKEVLDDILANQLPVDGEAASLFNKVAVVTNDSYKRTFAGSRAFLIVAIIIAVVSCYLNENAYPLIYFGLSCIMYWFASRTPNYILVEKELKTAKTGKQSKSFMSGTIAGILGLAATAPVFVKVITNANTGEVVGKQEDHSMTWIAWAFSIILFFIIAYLMIFVSIFNYLRNYVFRK